jgi:membrane-bound lytic murein transglycosylase B
MRAMPNGSLIKSIHKPPLPKRQPLAGAGLAPRLVVVFLMLFCLSPLHGWGADWTPLIDRLVGDGYSEMFIRSLFNHPQARFDPAPMSQKIESLVRRPARKLPPDQYGMNKDVYKDFLQPDAINRAYAFSLENKKTLKRMRAQYCVPEEVVVSIMLVETRLGKQMGSKKAFNVLASMAVARDLEKIRVFLPSDLITPANEGYARMRCREKSDWAYRELKSLLRYAEKNRMDPLEIPGSIFGAIGLCQFMPSNISAYGADTDGDGRIDLFATDDALHSIGKYLHGHGWKCRMSRKNQHRVVMAYNHSHVYANTVLSIAEKLRSKARGSNEKQRAQQASRS